MKRVVILVWLSVFTLVVFSQNKLQFSGALDGVSNGVIKLLDSKNNVVLQADMKNGQFSTAPIEIVPDVYSIQFAAGKIDVFLSNSSVKITGYVNPSDATDNDIQLEGEGGALNQRWTTFESNLKAMKSNYMADYFKGYRDAQTPEEKDYWAGVYDYLEDSISHYTASYIRTEPSPELASYLAYSHHEPFYENANTVYQALSQEAQNTFYGKELKKIMHDELFSFANGQIIQDYVLQDSAGNTVRISDLKGKITIIDFWASWCGPCKLEMQKIRAMKENWDANKVQIVSVSMDDTRAVFLKAVQDEKLPWKCWWESKGFNKSDMKAIYHFNQIPFLVVIDANQRIVAKKIRRNELNRVINKLILEN